MPMKLLVGAGADVNRGLTADVGTQFVHGTTALDILLHSAAGGESFSGNDNSPFVSQIRLLAQAGAMPSPDFNWEFTQSHMTHGFEHKQHKRAVNERWRAYFDKLARAGGFDAHARAERRTLVVIADKFLGLSLAPQVIPIVVDFWAHPGDPWFLFSDLSRP